MRATSFFFFLTVALELAAIALAIAAVIRARLAGLRRAIALAVCAPLAHFAAIFSLAAGMKSMLQHFGRSTTLREQLFSAINDPLDQGVLPVAILLLALLLVVAGSLHSRANTHIGVAG